MGCAIARRLSFTTARVALVEAAGDVGEGASKGNTGIATCGADCPPGSLEAELVKCSSPGWEALCASLDTPFRRIGSLAVARTAEEEARLEGLRAGARANRCEAEIVTGERARALEPMLTPSARAALHVPGDGIVDPLRLTIGYAELAARNGVAVHLDAPVTGLRMSGERITHVETRGSGDRRRVRRERRGHRGRHGLAARRRRAVHDVAAAGAVLAARPRGRLEVPGDRGRRPDRREPRRLLRPDHARVAAPRPDGARRDGPARPGHGRGDARRCVRRGPAARAGARPPLGDQNVCRQPTGVRARLPDRDRPEPRQPGPRRRHPLDRRLVVAGGRRAGARDPRRGRCAGAGRAPGGGDRSGSRSRGSSGTAIRRRSSRATRPTATSCARASR